MSNFELKNVTKKFRTVTALSDVSFDVQNSEFFVLLGPTGAGKTTTLRVIAGLEKQNEGTVSFDGESIDKLTPADRDVAFVFQQYSLYPTMTVYDNLAFPLRAPSRNTPRSRDQTAGAGSRRDSADSTPARSQNGAAIRRRDAARRHRH